MNRNFWKTFRKAYPLIYRPAWRENLLLSFVDIFHGLSFALVVILTQRFFDSITASADGTGGRNEVIVTAAALIACQIASQLLNGFVNFYSDVVREKGYGRICALLQEKISRLRPVDFEKNSFLTDIDMADEGAKDACEMVDTANSVITFYVPYFALMGIYMVRLDWGLLSALLLVFLPVLLTNLVKMHFGDRIERQIAPTRREAEAYEQTLTTLENYRETRVLGAARYFLRLYREAVEKWNRTAWKYRKKEAAISLGLNCFSFLSYGGILLLLVSGCVRGQISVGAFAAVFSSIDVMFLLMEEIFQDSSTFLLHNAADHLRFMIIRQGKQIDHRAAGSRFRIGRTEIDPRDPRVDDCACAHRARLERDVQLALPQPPASQIPARPVYRLEFGMAERVFPGFAAIPAPGDDFPLIDQYGAHRDFALLCGFLREQEGFFHKAIFFHDVIPFRSAPRRIPPDTR